MFDLRLKAPFTMILCGPSSSGKTSLLVKLLLAKKEIITQPPEKIRLYYSIWQDSYDNLKTKGIISDFVEGIPTGEDLEIFQKSTSNSLVIFDDLAEQLTPVISNLFVAGSHHYNTSVILISQNLFQKNPIWRVCSLNSTYLVLLKNPRDPSQIGVLSRQSFPGHKNFLGSVYARECEQPHSYLVLDYHQQCNPILKVRGSLLGKVIKCFTPDTCSKRMSGYKCMFLVNDQVYKKLVRSNEECSKNALSDANSNINSIHINNDNHGNSKSFSQEVPFNGHSNDFDKGESQGTKSPSSIEKEVDPMEIDTEEYAGNSQNFSNFRDRDNFEKPVLVNSEVQTDKPKLKNSESQHESLNTASIGINTLKNNKNKKIQTQKVINKDVESQTSEKNVKNSGVQTSKINFNVKRKLPLPKSEIKKTPNEQKSEITDKVSDNPIPPKKTIPSSRSLPSSKIEKPSDNPTNQPSRVSSLWGPSPEVVVNFPPKKESKKLLLNKPLLEKSKSVGPIKRKSFFPESKRKKFKTELAGKRKSENRSSRFPEIRPKKLKTVKARISVLNPNQINNRWADSSSEDDD